MNLDLPLLHSIWTVLLLVTFIAIVLWAYVFRSKQDFDAAARLPLDDDEAETQLRTRGDSAMANEKESS